MANYVYTDYVIEGSPLEIADLNNFFTENSNDNGYGKLWEIIPKALPEAEGDMRGDYEVLGRTMTEDKFEVRTFSAWRRNALFEKMLLSIAPDIRMFYYEDMDDGFSTNDTEGKYFGNAFKIDYCLEEDSNIETFSNETEFLSRFNHLMGTDFENADDAIRFADDWEDEDNEDYFINVYRNN